MCLDAAAKLGGPLRSLDRIECTVVGNRTMARIHREFLDIQGPTDVITFPYGEILVCAPVADSRAREFGHDVTTELALYCIHGLLHLAGHDDTNPALAKRMAKEQEKILAKAVGNVSAFNPKTAIEVKGSRSLRDQIAYPGQEASGKQTSEVGDLGKSGAIGF